MVIGHVEKKKNDTVKEGMYMKVEGLMYDGREADI